MSEQSFMFRKHCLHGQIIIVDAYNEKYKYSLIPIRMTNTLGEEVFIAPRLQFKHSLEEASSTLKSSRAKEELSNLSPIFGIHEAAQRTVRKRRDREISAWTESELPCVSPTSRKVASVLKKRKQSLQQERLLLHTRRSKTSCLTECDIETNRIFKKREVTVSKISFYESELPFKPILNTPKFNREGSPLYRLKHPFKSSTLLSMKKKRKCTYFDVPLKQKQRKTSEKFEVDDLFKDEKRGSKSRLLNFVKSINDLMLREKSECKLQKVHLL